MHTKPKILCAVLMMSIAFGSARAGANVPSPGELPKGGLNIPPTVSSYQEVATATFKMTMGKDQIGTPAPKKRHKDLTWIAFADSLEDTARPGTYLPRWRTTAWLVGGFGLKPNGKGSYESKAWPEGAAVDLHEIGAQHRSAEVLVRVVTKKGNTANVRLYLVEKDGTAVDPKDPDYEQKVLDENSIYGPLAKGFFLIRKSAPQRLGAQQHRYDNRYVLISDDKETTLEVYFPMHPPGSESAQTEDGGPPPVPPVNEN
jgi:hypothetical protein